MKKYLNKKRNCNNINKGVVVKMKLEKEYLVKVNGIGDIYAGKIIDVYGTFDELRVNLREEGAEFVAEQTGVPEHTIRKVERKLGALRRLYMLETEPDGVVEDEINSLEEKIPDLSYHDTEEGNVCMKEHLEEQLEWIEDDSHKWVKDEIAKIERRL